MRGHARLGGAAQARVERDVEALHQRRGGVRRRAQGGEDGRLAFQAVTQERLGERARVGDRRAVAGQKQQVVTAGQQPPQAAEAFNVGMAAASTEMMMASGQYDATFGARAQELSGVALDNRKDQGERATFHYLDNFAAAIRFTGKQLIDLIKEYNAHGFVMHSNRSCKPYSLVQEVIRRQVMRETGVPGLMIEADMADPRAYAKEPVRNRVQAFLETLEQ